MFTLAVFVGESAVLTALAGGSFGKLATGLRVVRTTAAAARSTCCGRWRAGAGGLVIPPLVFRPDGRGLHDLVAGTATVTVPR